MDENRTLHPWELALLLSVCLTLVVGAWAGARQEGLSDSLVRLHVIAASDSAADQAEKLRVRDAVLSYLAPKLEAAESISDARAILRAEQAGIRKAARSVTRQNVTVTFTREHYPTRDYGSFALPAGTYPSLRVILGSGQGHNWWCVAFPALCTLSASQQEEALEAANFTRAQRDLLTGEDMTVELKFKSLELWKQLRQWLQAH